MPKQWRTAVTLLRQPDGFSDIDARDGFGGVYVGRGGGIATNGGCNGAWRGSMRRMMSSTFIPMGLRVVFAVGVSNNSQVGWGKHYGVAKSCDSVARLFAVAVDLHPSDYLSSVAYGVSDLNQVGWGFKTSPTYGDHALLWGWHQIRRRTSSAQSRSKTLVTPLTAKAKSATPSPAI